MGKSAEAVLLFDRAAELVQAAQAYLEDETGARMDAVTKVRNSAKQHETVRTARKWTSSLICCCSHSSPD
jgi:hypothetical protein